MEVVMIDPKSYPIWEKLDKKQRYRLSVFAEGGFDLGSDEPERHKIQNHAQLVFAFYWCTFILSNVSDSLEIVADIFKQHLLDLSK